MIIAWRLVSDHLRKARLGNEHQLSVLNPSLSATLQLLSC